MRVIVLNIPFKAWIEGDEIWITVPPQGYGGIQWMVATHIEGLLDLGHDVTLLGAPGSPRVPNQMRVISITDRDEVFAWLSSNDYDIVHDFSNGKIFSPEWLNGKPWISTHHFTGQPVNRENTVYVSDSQASLCGSEVRKRIRIPVNLNRYRLVERKDDYLLYLGRVSAWKGVYESAEFASAIGMRLLVAGPVWEQEYSRKIIESFGDYVEFLGETGGEGRIRLIENASALMCLSQYVMGPWGDIWSEPGATVVSEAAASGTPVIGSENGCLPEIVPPVGAVVPYGVEITDEAAKTIFGSLPCPYEVRGYAETHWDHIKIAKEYEATYQSALSGSKWI